MKRFSLWHFLKPYKSAFIIACLAIILETGLEISIPFLMNLMLDNGMKELPTSPATYEINLSYTLMMGGVMIAFALVALGLGILTAKYTAKAGRGLGYELRRQEYLKIQSFSFSNLDNFRINSLVTRMTNDIQIISDTFCQSLRPVLRSPISLVFSLVLAIIMSRELSVVFGIIVPLLAAVLIIMAILVRPKFVRMQGALDRVNRTVQESLVAMKLIRANAKKDFEIHKFSLVNQEVKKLGTASSTLIVSNMAIMQFMTYACIIGILYVGGNSALKLTPNQADVVNDMATFLNYVTQTLAALNMLSNVFMSLSRAEASYTRIKEVFKSTNEIIDNPNSTIKMKDGAIQFDDVTFSYSNDINKAVLQNVSFEIVDGEFVGILGQTGSSKSTLVYLLERFYDVNKGAIFISGHNVKDYSLKELRKNIAISFQSPRLFTGTVKENLLWGDLNATDGEIIEACKIACCYDFIVNKLPDGFNTQLGQTGSNVSGGQRQRLCIARAILRKPKILILDDSFSALDRVTEGQVKKNLREKLSHMTKIVIAQKVSTIQDADKIIVLNEGKINSIGTSEELLKTDQIYRDIYNLQNEGLKDACSN